MGSRRITDRSGRGVEPAAEASKREAGVSTLRSDGDSRTQSTAWDPYEVWLTRVKQPRDRRALLKPRVPPAPASQDTSDTGRFRALSPAPQR